jgi:prevent-host-death family protein
VEQIAISKFKATCLAVLDQVRKTKKPILVTRFGVPVAEIVPPSAPPRKSSWIGSMAGTGEIIGDIISPATPLEDWDVERT